MTPQLSLTYSAPYVGEADWQRQLVAIRAAVQYLGLKEVSYALDVSGSMLSDSLNERDRKRWAASWTCIVYRMLVAKGDGIAFDLARSLYSTPLEDAPHEVNDRVVELTEAQIIAAYEAEFRAMGDDGKAALKRARRGGRR